MGAYRRRIVMSVAAGVAVAAAVSAPMLPAAANVLNPPAVVGYIDSIAISYVQDSPSPSLHVAGWAGDLNDGWENGRGAAAIEIVATPAAGGATTTIAWAERQDYDIPRADVRRAYPQLGPNQGFDVRSAKAPSVGALKVCARMWNLNAAMPAGGWVLVGCASVTVPAARPSIATTPSSVVAGTPVTVTSGTTQGTDSFAWSAWNPSAPDPSGYPQPIPGATSASFVATARYIGYELQAVVTTRVPGRANVEQYPYMTTVNYPDHTGDRVSGSDRFGSSVAVSQAAFPDAAAGVPVAYLASGIDFPDALSAGPAAAVKHGTLLLTMPGALDPRIGAELTRLHPPLVVVAGGPAVIADAVLDAVRALPFAPEVRRIAGADRFETSRAVALDAFGATAPSVYLATGRGFADALTAGAAAAAAGAPVLLTDGARSTADAATQDVLAGWGTRTVSVVGGLSSVSAGVAASLGPAISVTRFSGGDRFGTAAAVAAAAPASSTTYFASGFGFPDALSVSALAGTAHAPLLLTTGSCIPVVELQGMLDRGVNRFRIIGGETVQGTEIGGGRPC
ncbi:cell wall-binding repeat-containing protein [Leifsonia aquatica]|uniref:cell wall-binding repeat-containing protein n=1 Tax=Leifsonia aquatica TaxID=144185 RepID=UPI00384BF1E8